MGTTITINGVDGFTLARLEAEARRRGVTVGDAARDLLRRGLIAEADTSGTKDDLAELGALIGTWTAADAEEFDVATEPMRQTDPEMCT